MHTERSRYSIILTGISVLLEHTSPKKHKDLVNSSNAGPASNASNAPDRRNSPAGKFMTQGRAVQPAGAAREGPGYGVIPAGSPGRGKASRGRASSVILVQVAQAWAGRRAPDHSDSA